MSQPGYTPSPGYGELLGSFSCAALRTGFENSTSK